jgi:hypothetical protein
MSVATSRLGAYTEGGFGFHVSMANMYAVSPSLGFSFHFKYVTTLYNTLTFVSVLFFTG